MADNLRITAATYDEPPEIAGVHVAAWRETYRGLVPQSYLDSLSVAVRLERWQKQFDLHANDDLSGLLIARLEGAAAGFLSLGRARDEDRPEYGEIYALYVLQRHWGRGIGYRLYQEARDRFRSKGLGQIYLWVLETNRHAVETYLRWGGRVEPGRRKPLVIGGLAAEEISIAFDLV